MSRVVGWGKTVFRKYPLICNTAIYGSFYTAAELSQQTFNKYNSPEKPEIDYKSAARIVTVGSGLYAPTLFYCYLLIFTLLNFEMSIIYDYNVYCDFINNIMIYCIFTMYKFLDKKFVGTATKTVVTKLLLEQFTMTPVLLASFFIILGYLEGKPIFDELKEKYWKAFIANQCFWLPAQTINFGFLPPQLRVVYVATMSFIWINVLCFIKRQKMETLPAVQVKKDL